MTDGKEEPKTILERVRKNPYSLHINRAPKKVVDEFKQWAFEEHEGDFGLAFQELWLTRIHAFEPLEHVIDTLSVLDEKVNALQKIVEDGNGQQKDDSITLCNGKKIAKG